MLGKENWGNRRDGEYMGRRSEEWEKYLESKYFESCHRHWLNIWYKYGKNMVAIATSRNTIIFWKGKIFAIHLSVKKIKYNIEFKLWSHFVIYIYVHRKILEYMSTNKLLVVLDVYEKYRFLKTFVILRKIHFYLFLINIPYYKHIHTHYSCKTCLTKQQIIVCFLRTYVIFG